MTGKVKAMYDADIARGADPDYALSRAMNTLAGQMQANVLRGKYSGTWGKPFPFPDEK
jgi:hypothetical protein